MKVLGIETATLLGSVALVSDDEVIAEYSLNVRTTHSERLMGMIERVLSDTSIALKDLDGIAVSIGPGSFTGLRIGLSTAKGLCFANALPLAAVPTLDALAARVPFSRYPLCPVLDAKKKEVYAAVYEVLGEEPRRISEPKVASLDALLKGISGPTVFLGDGVTVFRVSIQEALGKRPFFAPADLAHPRAAAVARLGLLRLGRGEVADVSRVEPLYLRKSEAELMRRRT